MLICTQNGNNNNNNNARIDMFQEKCVWKPKLKRKKKTNFEKAGEKG